MQCSWPEEVDTSSMTDNSDILFKFQSGAILANTTSGYVVADPDAEKYRLLSHLEKKGYTSINKFDTLFVGERKMNVVLGQNCGESVIRLNATTYLDKI
ncbi:hypothetical protein KKG31_08450 [Patescibacteria group bacterium]|nr:hypothetical protein [Patescibacteria group bacterium]MBU1759087.1 hypothetical protein [Patescibacteria group bacterium]